LRKPLIIAIIAAIIFALAIFFLVEGREATRPVVIAAQDMPFGTVVDDDMLRVISVPVGAAVGVDTISTVSDIIGKTVVISRAAGDLIPLESLGSERIAPSADNGFITMTVSVQEAAALMAGDSVAFSVFDHGSGSELLEGFTVKAVITEEQSAHLLLEGHVNNILMLSPFLASRSYFLIRTGGSE